MVDQVEDLPAEVIDNILSFLPFKDLCNTQEASKVFHVLSDSAQMKKDEMIKKIKEFKNDTRKGIYWAARIGDKYLVEFFIEKRFNELSYAPDLKNNHSIDWGKCMCAAAEGGHKELVQFFLEKGADEDPFVVFNPKIDWGRCMKSAAKGGNKDLIALFIEKATTFGIPLKRHLDRLESSRGLDDRDWNRGMFGAAEGGHKDLVEFFIDKGAEDWQGGIHYAAKGGHMNLINFFIEKGANNPDNIFISLLWNDAMEGAAKRGHMDLIKLCIGKGADFWYWGIYYAAEGGQLEIVKFFIEKQASLSPILNHFSNPFLKKGAWNRCMKHAALNGHLEIVKLLLDNGANNLNKGMCGAAKGGYLEIIKFFIEKASEDPDGRNRASFDWNKGMVCAAHGGHKYIVDFFIEKGAHDWDWGIKAADHTKQWEIVHLFKCLIKKENSSFY